MRLLNDINATVDGLLPSSIAYADGLVFEGDDIRVIGRNSDVLLNACKNIGLTQEKLVYSRRTSSRHDGK